MSSGKSKEFLSRFDILRYSTSMCWLHRHLFLSSYACTLSCQIVWVLTLSIYLANVRPSTNCLTSLWCNFLITNHIELVGGTKLIRCIAHLALSLIMRESVIFMRYIYHEETGILSFQQFISNIIWSLVLLNI